MPVNIYCGYFGYGNQYHRMARGNGSSAVWLTNQVSGSTADETYHNLEARWLDADNTKAFNLDGIVDGSSKLLADDSEYTSRTYMGFASWSNAEWRIDRVYVRKCQAVEPAAEISGTFERPSNPASTPATLTTTFEYDDYNKLTEITFPDSTTEILSYDDNGQLMKSEKSTGETTNYEWNDQGMLVKVILPTGEPVEYEYDGTQRLTGRKDSEGEDLFMQSGWDIVTKMDDVGKRTYYTGMSAVSGAGASSVSGSGSGSGSSSAFSASESASASDSAKYFHYNHRGDTVLVTDANGEILHNLNYEAYGKPTNNEGIPINTLSLNNATNPGDSTGSGANNLPNLFVCASGIKYDTKTNLHYMRFRWFSPSQMRFISPDLLMDLNRYAYVSGNPISFIDQFGLFMIIPPINFENQIKAAYPANKKYAFGYVGISIGGKSSLFGFQHGGGINVVLFNPFLCVTTHPPKKLKNIFKTSMDISVGVVCT